MPTATSSHSSSPPPILGPSSPRSLEPCNDLLSAPRKRFLQLVKTWNLSMCHSLIFLDLYTFHFSFCLFAVLLCSDILPCFDCLLSNHLWTFVAYPIAAYPRLSFRPHIHLYYRPFPAVLSVLSIIFPPCITLCLSPSLLDFYSGCSPSPHPRAAHIVCDHVVLP